MKITIDISDEMAEQIVREELRDAYIRSDPETCRKVDRKDFKKLRKALRRVHWYFTGEDIRDDLD